MAIRFVHQLKSEFMLVLFANLFSYIITFSGSVIYVRLLGKTEFGLYTFAFGIISLFLLVNGLGTASGLLQHVSRAKSDSEKIEYLHFAMRSGMLFNLVLGLAIIVYALVMPLPLPYARPVLLSMALFPMGRLYIDIFQAYLRANSQNRQQAYFLILNNCVLLIVNVVGVVLFKLYGLVYFTYLGYLVMFVFSSWKLKLPALFGKFSYTNIRPRAFISYSLFTSLSNAFAGLLFVLDTIIIAYVVKNAELVAIYRVATLIPFALNFIPNIAVNFYYPEFAKNADDPARIRYLSRALSLRLFIFSATVSAVLIIFARPLILKLFGSNYMDSVLPFQIISFGYWIIASFRTVNGNILAALGKARLSFNLTCGILVVNIAVTYFLVVHYAIIGAACGIVIMYGVSSLVGYIALKQVLHNLEIRGKNV